MQRSSLNITWNSILSTSFAMGFIEEIPFRGLIFQEPTAVMGHIPANLISSALFTAIHFPGWLLAGGSLLPSISVFFIGVILAMAFYYSKSLWSVIIAHSFNDFLAFVVFNV